jgi:two-component system, LytTR family, response regulator
MTLRVLIVDDEPPARRKIRALLHGDDRFIIAGEAGDGLEAVNRIEAEQPDLIFLDIQMPGLSGFEVLEALGAARPQVIFTTAYDEYAVRAFEVRALDYLLKPFDQDRFRQALDRALEDRRRRGSLDAKVDGLVGDWRAQQGPLQRLLIRDRERMRIVRADEIEWIEAEEKYVRLHLPHETLLHRETMSNLERRLDAQKFVRIHRRQIVNLNSVVALAPWTHGDCVLILANGRRLSLGRAYRRRFLELFT